MPNQVGILVGSHNGVLLFVTNPELIGVLSTISDIVSGFENLNSIPKPSSKKTGYP